MSRDEILSTLFGGGRADYDMLEKCDYSFDEVLFEIRGFTLVGEMTFNDILVGAICIYKNNIQEKIEQKIKESDDTEMLEKLQKLNANDDIQYYVNYLDTKIFIEDYEVKEIYREYLSSEIDEENEKIGFVWLDLDESEV